MAHAVIGVGVWSRAARLAEKLLRIELDKAIERALRACPDDGTSTPSFAWPTMADSERRLRAAAKRLAAKRTYNHTREDSTLMPCPRCAATDVERTLAEALADARRKITTLERKLREQGR